MSSGRLEGFEHAVVNLFVIPAGMMLGADVTVGDWWLWNQLPVLAGNLVGGVLLTGLGLYWAHRRGLEALTASGARAGLTGDVTGAGAQAPAAPSAPAGDTSSASGSCAASFPTPDERKLARTV